MTDAAPKKKPRLLLKLAGVLVVLVAIAGVTIALVWVAPTPPMFEQQATLASAEAQAAEEGKFVLAVSTANWCAMCQMYKRGALVDDRIEAWAEANAVPVYAKVDEDVSLDERLGVEGKPGTLPVTTLLRDGEIVKQQEGLMDADALLAWLEAAESPAAP